MGRDCAYSELRQIKTFFLVNNSSTLTTSQSAAGRRRPIDSVNCVVRTSIFCKSKCNFNLQFFAVFVALTHFAHLLCINQYEVPLWSWSISTLTHAHISFGGLYRVHFTSMTFIDLLFVSFIFGKWEKNVFWFTAPRDWATAQWECRIFVFTIRMNK